MAVMDQLKGQVPGQQILKEFDKLEYDTIEAFRRIEEKLMRDIIRNLKKSVRDAEDVGTTNWRIEELKRLEQYRLSNLKQYQPTFDKLNAQIEQLMRSKYYEGMDNEQRRILSAIKHGYNPTTVSEDQAIQVFKLNERKLNALIKATTNDMEKAEQALLRRANDEYRKIIYDAEVGLNTGALTPFEAVDMATKDMRARGLQCVEYKNGAKHTLLDYADMAVKTADKKAYLYGEGEMRQEMGCHLVLVGQRGGFPCECCLPYVGQVLIDDVYSGGSRADGNYTLMSTAMANGLFHPRCKDIATTYFPKVTKVPKCPTRDEKGKIIAETDEKTRTAYVNRQIEKYQRMSELSLNDKNKEKYAQIAEAWKKQL